MLPMKDFKEFEISRIDSVLEYEKDVAPKTNPWRDWWRKNADGWRFGLLACAVSTFLVFLINLLLALLASVKYGLQTFDIGFGQLVLYEGSCTITRDANIGIHLVINTLSTIILSSCNFCMQCLSAPTREEVDAAHAKNAWLDIGVQSIHNLRNISRKRAWIWLLLGVSSLPLHLFYNSAVFSSVATVEYELYTAYESFLTSTGPVVFNISSADRYSGSNVSMTPEEVVFAVQDAQTVMERMRAMAANGSLERLEPADCIAVYSNAYGTSRANLLLVQDRKEGVRNPKVPPLIASMNGLAVTIEDVVTGWMCTRNGYGDLGTAACESHLTQMQANASDWAPFDGRVKYCLSEIIPEKCRLQTSVHIMVTIVALNFVKAGIMLYLVFWFKDSPLLTMGDAVASFLSRPDPYTKDMCLLSRTDIERKPNRWTMMRLLNRKNSDTKSTPLSHPQQSWNGISLQTGVHTFKSTIKRKFCTSSKRRWISTMTLFLLALILALSALTYGLVDLSRHSFLTSYALRSLGLGGDDLRTTIYWALPRFGPVALLLNVLLANLPQLFLSLLYISYNAIFTNMAMATEWAAYAKHRKGLRVSEGPRGEQRSTHFLQLPYRSAIPLMAASALLHWLLSQSLFLVYIETYNSFRQRTGFGDIVTCGYSPLAIIVALVLSVLLVGVVVLVGARRLPSAMPVAGSCSAAIAAACQPRKDGSSSSYVALEKLAWGDMEFGPGVGHCGFSDEEVREPIDGSVYR